MTTLVQKTLAFSPSLNKKATPKKTHANKENMLAGSGTPASGNGKLKQPFKIFSDTTAESEGSGKKGRNGKRRSLAPLQPTAEGGHVLTGRVVLESTAEDLKPRTETTTAPVLEKSDDSLVREALDVFEEAENEQENADNDAGTPHSPVKVTPELVKLVNDAAALMEATGEEGEESYWKQLAEERRLALEETLDENDKLYDEIDRLREENDGMKKDLNELNGYKILYLNAVKDGLVDDSADAHK